jgi:hypothetical protein
VTHPGGGSGTGPGGGSGTGPGRTEPPAPDWWPGSQDRWIAALKSLADVLDRPEVARLMRANRP